MNTCKHCGGPARPGNPITAHRHLLTGEVLWYEHTFACGYAWE